MYNSNIEYELNNYFNNLNNLLKLKNITDIEIKHVKNIGYFVNIKTIKLKSINTTITPPLFNLTIYKKLYLKIFDTKNAKLLNCLLNNNLKIYKHKKCCSEILNSYIIIIDNLNLLKKIIVDIFKSYDFL